MREGFMKWLMIVLIIFQINNVFACNIVQVFYQTSKFDVCYIDNKKNYLSKECKTIKDCFPVSVKITETFPNQSPGFTLCYAIKGEPIFAKVSNTENKIPVCKLGKSFVDIESLLWASK